MRIIKHKIKLLIISQTKVNGRAVFHSFGSDNRENIKVYCIFYGIIVLSFGSIKMYVQDAYDGHEAVDAAAADHYYSMTDVSLTSALMTARHLHSLSRRIKSTLRHELKSAGRLSSVTVDGY